MGIGKNERWDKEREPERAICITSVWYIAIAIDLAICLI